VKTGAPGVYKPLELPDSNFRRNDEKLHFQSFYEFVNLANLNFGLGFFPGLLCVRRGEIISNRVFPSGREGPNG